jgi:hypothetical protein
MNGIVAFVVVALLRFDVDAKFQIRLPDRSGRLEFSQEHFDFLNSKQK